MRKIIILLPIILLSFTELFAQNIIISGYITDESTGEKLIGANVYNAKTLKGTVSNNFGFYSLSIHPEDTLNITVSFIGYKKQNKVIIADKSCNINFVLIPNSQNLKEVIISSQKGNAERTQMSITEIPMKQIKSLPVFMGETDVLKSLQLMPGVQGGQEGSNALYVRGGSPDQNLILLDDVPLYYVSHLGGFVSVFDANAISNIKLIKGGFPAQYGGRLSSIIDIRMKDGNQNKMKGEFAMGTLVSKIALEGPLGSKNTTYLFSARRSFFDLLSRTFQKLFSNEDLQTWYYLYDINAKICHRFSDKDRLFFSIYTGGDKFGIKSNVSQTFMGKSVLESEHETGILWGNIMTALRWNHVYNNKLFSNTSISYTGFRYNNYSDGNQTTNSIKTTFGYDFYSGIKDWNLKTDFDYYPSQNHKMKFGYAAIFHNFKPGISSYDQKGGNTRAIDTTINSGNLNATESYIFAEDEWIISPKLSVNLGLHAVAYFVENTSFFSVQPRINANYQFLPAYYLKASYADMQQNLHLLSNSGAGFPTDLWVPATKKVEPEHSTQIAVGVAHDILKENTNIEISVEAYYKTLSNLIEFQEGVSFYSASTWEEKIEKNGNASVYGLEFLIHKKEGKINGWIGYTLSKNTRQFDNLNNGYEFPYRYDRRHDISIVINYDISEKISLSCSWVYGTGNAITLATEKSNLMNFDYQTFYNNPDFVIYDDVHNYNGRNNYRMPAFHKLDIGINFTKKLKHGTRVWNISIYNVYNRQNPFMLYFKTIDGNIKLVQMSLFPIIPSFSYSYRF